jgi:hypothetical protein
MEEDEYIVVRRDREGDDQNGWGRQRIPKCVAVAGSELFERMLSIDMREKSHGTFKATSLFHPNAWLAALAALQGETIDLALVDADIKLSTLELIDFLSPKDTTEGSRLTSLHNLIMEQLPQSFEKGTTQHTLAIQWALYNDNMRALATIEPDDLKRIIPETELEDLSPSVIGFLVQHPAFGNMSDAPHGLWQHWKKVPSQTARGEALQNAINPRIRFSSSYPVYNITPYGMELISQRDRDVHIFDVNSTLDGWATAATLSAPNFRVGRAVANGCYIAACGYGYSNPSFIMEKPEPDIGLCIWSAIEPRKLLHQIPCSHAFNIAICESSVATVHKKSVQVWNMVTGDRELKIQKEYDSTMRLSLARSFIVIEDISKAKIIVCDRKSGTAILSLDDIGSYFLNGNVLYTAKRNDCIRSWVRADNSMEPLHQVIAKFELWGLFCEGTTVGGLVVDKEVKEIKKWDLSTGRSLPSILLPGARGINTLISTTRGLIVNYYAGDGKYITDVYGDTSQSTLT